MYHLNPHDSFLPLTSLSSRAFSPYLLSHSLSFSLPSRGYMQRTLRHTYCALCLLSTWITTRHVLPSPPGWTTSSAKIQTAPVLKHVALALRETRFYSPRGEQRKRIPAAAPWISFFTSALVERNERKRETERNGCQMRLILWRLFFFWESNTWRCLNRTFYNDSCRPRSFVYYSRQFQNNQANKFDESPSIDYYVRSKSKPIINHDHRKYIMRRLTIKWYVLLAWAVRQKPIHREQSEPSNIIRA